MQTRTYRILGLLGRGGYGSVYRAEKSGGEGFSTVVALKMLHPGLVSTGSSGHAAEAARRLRDEARLLGLLRHRAIVQVHDLVVLGGSWTIVMEYVEGLDLGGPLGRCPMPARPALDAVAQVADALAFAWRSTTPGGRELRLLHRDIKPSNVMLTTDGAVKVLDFGIARADFDSRESTTSATILGTRSHMAPERLDPDGELGPVGPEADVYSLGAVLLELLGGAPPPRAALDPEAHAFRMREALAERLDGRVDVRVAGLLERMIAFAPSDRPPADEVRRAAEALARALPGDTLRAWAERCVPSALEAHRTALATNPDALVGTVLEEMSDVVTPPPHDPLAPPRWEGAPTNVPLHPLVLDDERIVPVGMAFDDEGTGPLAGVHLTLDSLDGDTAAPRDVRGPPPRRAPLPIEITEERTALTSPVWLHRPRLLGALGLLAVLGGATAAWLATRPGGPAEEVLPSPPGAVAALPALPPPPPGPPATGSPDAPAEPIAKLAPKPAPKAEAPPKPAPRDAAPAAPAEPPVPPDVDHSQKRRSAIEALRGSVQPAPGTFRVEGPVVAVQLAARGTRHAPGDSLEPGRYEIWARFAEAEAPVRAGVVDVPPGGTVVVACDPDLGMCAPR